MPVFDHWAYIFALLLYAPVRGVEAAVVVPPPEVMAAQHLGHTPVMVAKPLPKMQCRCSTMPVVSPSSQPTRSTPVRKLRGGR